MSTFVEDTIAGMGEDITTNFQWFTITRTDTDQFKMSVVDTNTNIKSQYSSKYTLLQPLVSYSGIVWANTESDLLIIFIATGSNDEYANYLYMVLSKLKLKGKLSIPNIGDIKTTKGLRGLTYTFYEMT